MTTGRRFAVMVVAVVVAVVVATATGAAPAHADDEIGLSLDGQHWTDQLRRPLFGPGFRWVPGDRETRSFYVSNQGPSDARMTIEVVTDDQDGLLSDGDIDLRARAAGREWVSFANGHDVTELVEAPVDRGGRTRVDVRVSFDPASTNRSMTDVLPLEIVVTLSQDDPLQGNDGDDGDGDGNLPDTGNVVPLWAVVLGAALVGGGLALLAGSRRQERADG